MRDLSFRIGIITDMLSLKDNVRAMPEGADTCGWKDTPPSAVKLSLTGSFLPILRSRIKIDAIPNTLPDLVPVSRSLDIGMLFESDTVRPTVSSRWSESAIRLGVVTGQGFSFRHVLNPS